MIQALIRHMIDWFFVFFLITVIFWFVLTSPLIPIPFQSSNQLVLQVDPVSLRTHVIEMANYLSPRTADYNGHRPTADYIHKIYRKNNVSVKHQWFNVSSGTFSNVIASYGPNTNQVIVIGAHYDSINSVPGADDNASGVAALLELSRLLAKVEKNLKMKVELVAYALGDANRIVTNDMGSFYHAEQLKKQNKQVVFMLSVDNIGYFDTRKGSQKHPFNFLSLLYPDQANYIAITGRISDIGLTRKIKYSFKKASKIPIYSLNIPEFISYIGLSDQQSYWSQGYKAIQISDTTKFRNPYYDTNNDLPEKLDYDRMAWVVQGIYQAIIDIAYVQH